LYGREKEKSRENSEDYNKYLDFKMKRAKISVNN